MLPLILTSVSLGILISLSQAAPEVTLGPTTLIGRDVTGLKQDFFGGIPYAEPPIGQLRLKPPVLKTSLDVKSFDASNFGRSCLQPGVPAAFISEDCLTINIFRPSGTKPFAALPILFWTYGGGFIAGSSSIYNGSAIVAQSVARGTPLVYVNFNYRLGPLGFPQGQEADDEKALNLAIRDELAALAWVQKNIGLFGGDKNKVTAFGESAGAIMTSILYLNSPLSSLVRGVILESGSPASSLTYNAARRETSWQNFVQGIPSCASQATSGHTFTCIKSANSSEILSGLLNSLSKSPELFPFDPTLDGPGGLMPALPSQLYAQRHFARIPFIAGTNLDEGTAFTPPTISSEAEIRLSIVANFSPPIVSPQSLEDTADKLLELYPDIPALGSPFGTGNETFGLSSVYKQTAALQGDISFQSQRRLFSQVTSEAGVKSFGYLFTEPQPGPPQLGVTHGTEVNYVYGNPAITAPTGILISKTMIEYWVSFATCLDPNDGRGLKRPRWDQYTPRHQVLMQLNGADLKLIPDNYRKKQIDFINSRPLVFHHRRNGL